MISKYKFKPFNYKHIIWDWNGTLIDDAWLFVEVMNKLLKKYDLREITIDKYKDVFGFPIKNYYKKLGFNTEKKYFEKLGLEFIKEYEKRLFDATLYPLTTIILSKLSALEIKHHILSASHQKLLNDQIKYYKIKKYFSHISGLNNYFAISKIDEGIKLVQKINTDNKDILLIGDTIHDFEVANELKIDCLLISHGHHSHARLLQTNNKVMLNMENIINELL